jgi:predicted secreted protein
LTATLPKERTTPMSHGFLYNVVLLLHLSAVVVGFGSNFVFPLLARGEGLAIDTRYAVRHAAYAAGKALTTGPIIATGILGLLLIFLSDQQWEFKQTWVSLAFLLYFGVVGVLLFLVAPNARAMDDLGARLAGMSADASSPEVTELEERVKKASAFNGIIHLLWLLLMIDMVWKFGAV